MRKLIFFILSVFLSLSLFAKKVELDNAKLVVKNYYFAQLELLEGIKNEFKKIEDVKFGKIFEIAEKGNTLMYIINIEKSFVIVAADDLVEPILGFSHKNNYSGENLPPALVDLLEFYKVQNTYAIEKQIDRRDNVKDIWENLLGSGDLKSGDCLSIGVKHGINNTGINFKYIDSGELSNPSFYGFDNIRSNLNFGLIVNLALRKHLSFQTEFNFVNRGFEFQSDPWVVGVSISGNYKTTYFTVPLLACYELGKTIKVYGYGGVSLNFLNDSENNITVTSTSTPELRRYDESYDPQDEFYKTEAGLVGGIGVKIPVYRQFQVFVDSRYEIGLTKAIKENIEYDNYHIVAAVKEAYNKSFSVNWGIIYTFKKK